MAKVFVDATTASDATGGVNSLLISAPSYSAGDVLIAVFARHNAVGGSDPVSLTSGWTPRGQGALTGASGTSAIDYSIFTKTATVEPADYTFSWTANSSCLAMVACYSGTNIELDPINPNDQWGDIAVVSSDSYGPDTAINAGEMYLAFHIQGANGTITIDGAQTLRASVNEAGAGGSDPGLCMALGDETLVSAGATTVRNWTSSVAACSSIITILLTEPPPFKRFYLRGTAVAGENFFEAQDDGTVNDGPFNFWFVQDQAATRYARFVTVPDIDDPGPPSSTASAEPDSDTLSNDWTGGGAADGFRTTLPLTGTFDAGTWTLTSGWQLASGDSAGVRGRWRIWRSVNADGSSPVELTSSTLVGSTITINDFTAEPLISTATWGAASFSLASEYLFFQLALELVTAATDPSTYINFFPGNTTTSPVRDSRVITPNFASTSVTDVNVTGLAGTGAIGSILSLFEYAVTGVSAAGALGAPVLTYDFSEFVVGVAGVGALGVAAPVGDATAPVTGIVGTAQLGSIYFGIPPARGQVGIVGYELGVLLTLGHAQPLSPAIGQVSGVVRPRIDYEFDAPSLLGSGALGTPAVALSPNASASVAGAGQLGAFSIRIDCDVHPVVPQLVAALGVPNASPVTLASVAGLEASGRLGLFASTADQAVRVSAPQLYAQLGAVRTQSGYGVLGVQGLGQIGRVGIEVALGVSGLVAVGSVGTVLVQADQIISVRGVVATGVIGHVHEDTPTVVADSVVGYGQLGVVGFLVNSRAPKRLYTHVPPAL